MAFVRVLLIHEFNCEICLEPFDCTPNRESGLLIFSHPLWIPGENQKCENIGMNFTTKISDHSIRVEVNSLFKPAPVTE